MTEEKMMLIKDNLSLSEAIAYIQSGEKGIFIRRDAPRWRDNFLGMFPDYFGGSGLSWFTIAKYIGYFGIYANGKGCIPLSEVDVFAKDWKVYKYKGKEL